MEYERGVGGVVNRMVLNILGEIGAERLLNENDAFIYFATTPEYTEKKCGLGPWCSNWWNRSGRSHLEREWSDEQIRCHWNNVRYSQICVPSAETKVFGNHTYSLRRGRIVHVFVGSEMGEQELRQLPRFKIPGNARIWKNKD